MQHLLRSSVRAAGTILLALALASPGGARAQGGQSAPAGPAAAGTEASPAAPDGDVTITIVKVRATGTRKEGVPVAVDPALERLHVDKLRLDYASYALIGTSERSVAWGGAHVVPVTEDGTFSVRAVEAAAEGKIVLAIEETAPGRPKRCLLVTLEVVPGRPQPIACEGMLPDGTILFFVSAVPLRS